MMKELRVALVPLARVNYDMELAEQVTKTFRTHLVMRGFRVLGGSTLITDLTGMRATIEQLKKEQFDLLLVFQASFADSTMVVELAETLDEPIFLWSLPEEKTGGRLRLNSLCGVNLAAHALKIRRRPYQYLYAKPDSTKGMQTLRSAVEAAAVYRRLKSARIGLIGEHPAGMDTCHLDEPELQSRLGVDLYPIQLETVFERINQTEPAAAAAVKQQLAKKLAGLDEVDQGQLHRSLGAYQSMKDIAREQKLDGLAVRCWPEFFTQMECSACGAMSMLNNEQLPCGCEADINGVITQLILQWLSGEPAFGTDIVSADFEENHIIVWHCGQAPLAMADPSFQPRATIHSNRRLPLLMEFPLKPGPVTVARLSRASGELRLVIGRGTMLSAPPSFSGTSGVLRFERPAEAVLDTLLGEGLEHHVALTYGDHTQSLMSLAKLLQLPVLEL